LDHKDENQYVFVVLVICVLTNSPQFSQRASNLAFVYEKQERYEEVVAEFQKAVELSGVGSSSGA
jgi:hypothetical protein